MKQELLTQINNSQNTDVNNPIDEIDEKRIVKTLLQMLKNMMLINQSTYENSYMAYQKMEGENNE